ncbi:peptidoglycan-recognition protein SD [Drosophila grimshawi]|uniref:GH14703 n=1 Tax=Drosophila grimshawi TaxID=7222 RepID=B4IX94_DROGR|nr:peptidoglycan-recognition protein SD [Drosophila grimshawi]EDV97426.1 GH14703 [Drosophila grimshawi]
MSSAWKLFAFVVCLAVGPAVQAGSELPIVSRQEWRARAPSGEMTAMTLPLARAVIAHTAGRGCSDDVSCDNLVRSIQSYQMTRAKYSDISYHYLIGGNGRIYEGRSPSQQGAIAAGNNAGSLAISFMGNFDEEPPTDAALAAGQALLTHAVDKGQLVEEYQLMGHRQLSATKSPGDALYLIIQKWPHYDSNLII